MHSELALNRYKFVSALIEMTFRLQISLKNQNLFRTKFLPLFYKTKPGNNRNHIRGYLDLQQPRQKQFKHTLGHSQPWCAGRELPHTIPLVELVLPFWVSPEKNKAFTVQQCKLSTMQALAGTHPACAQVHQPRKFSSHKKSPASLWTLVVPSHTPRYRGLSLLHAAEGLTGSPQEWGKLGQQQSQVGLAILFLPPSLPSTGLHLADTTEKREQTLPGSRTLANNTLLRRDSWAHTSFLGKSL